MQNWTQAHQSVWDKQQDWTLDIGLSNSLTSSLVSAELNSKTGHRHTSKCGTNSKTGHRHTTGRLANKLITSQQQDWTLGTRLADALTRLPVSVEQTAKVTSDGPGAGAVCKLKVKLKLSRQFMRGAGRGPRQKGRSCLFGGGGPELKISSG